MSRDLTIIFAFGIFVSLIVVLAVAVLGYGFYADKKAMDERYVSVETDDEGVFRT